MYKDAINNTASVENIIKLYFLIISFLIIPLNILDFKKFNNFIILIFNLSVFIKITLNLTV